MYRKYHGVCCTKKGVDDCCLPASMSRKILGELKKVGDSPTGKVFEEDACVELEGAQNLEKYARMALPCLDVKG